MRLTILSHQRLAAAILGLLVFWNVGLLRAQEAPVPPPDNLLPILHAPAADAPAIQPDSSQTVMAVIEAPPSDPAVRKLSLAECIQLGMEKQPALAAARASLNAAQSSLQGLNKLVLAGLIRPDLSIRKQQACLGVQIAAAALLQEEYQTRYAITRNYFSVIYARQQSALSAKAYGKLDRAAKKAKEIVDAGDPNSKVNAIDVENLTYNRDNVKVRGLEAVVGAETAMAALREAIGLGADEPLDISGDQLPVPVTNLDKKALIALALAQRGEMTKVQGAQQVTELEIRAQQLSFMPSATTFAAGADLHAKAVPQGVSNGAYRPWALDIEYPTTLSGRRRDRVERAMFLRDRAGSVVDKTEHLIALEVESSYAKWDLAARRLTILAKGRAQAAKIADFEQKRFDDGKTGGADLIRARLGEDQAEITYTETLYNHALGLAALERVTAGGFRIAP